MQKTAVNLQSWCWGAKEGTDSSLEPGLQGWAAPHRGVQRSPPHECSHEGTKGLASSPRTSELQHGGDGLCQKFPQHHRRPSWSLQLPRNKLHLLKSGAWLRGKAKRTLTALKRLEQGQRRALRSRWLQTRMRERKPREGGT